MVVVVLIVIKREGEKVNNYSRHLYTDARLISNVLAISLAPIPCNFISLIFPDFARAVGLRLFD